MSSVGYDPEETTAIAAHPLLAVLRQDTVLAEVDLKLATRSKTPDWSLEVAYQQRGPAYSNMVSIGVNIPLPLFPQQRQDRGIAASQAQLAQTETLLQDALRQHQAELRSNFEEWRSLRRRAQSLQRALVPLVDDRITQTLASYAGGNSTLAQVLEARRAAVDARMQVVLLERDTARAWAKVNFQFIESPIPPTFPERSHEPQRAVGRLGCVGVDRRWSHRPLDGRSRVECSDRARGPTSQAAYNVPSAKTDVPSDRKVLYWHDPMVPGQKFDKPGKSPFMDMQLVPVYADEAAGGGVSVSAGDDQQNLGLRTVVARKMVMASRLRPWAMWRRTSGRVRWFRHGHPVTSRGCTCAPTSIPLPRVRRSRYLCAGVGGAQAEYLRCGGHAPILPSSRLPANGCVSCRFPKASIESADATLPGGPLHASRATLGRGH